jgi:K+-transporting ATPase KdpF subunit
MINVAALYGFAAFSAAALLAYLVWALLFPEKV